MQELEDYLDLHTMQTAQATISYIKKKYKVNYSTTGVTKLLHRLRFSYKKPKVIPGKTDPEKQDQFIEEYHATLKSLGKNDSIHFLDASHPTHNTTASYGWIKKGRDGDKYIKTNTGRERLNLHGALNFKTKTAIVLSEKTINAESVIKLLNKLIKKYPHGKIHLILDNATYYHSNLVKEWKRHHARVKLHFLPSYSPNLNLIERLWHFYHKRVTSSRYFPTFQEFKHKSLYFFRHLDRYKKELNSLITDNFQTYPAATVANLS
jgi:transposase